MLLHLYRVIWIKLTKKSQASAVDCQKPLTVIHYSSWCLSSMIVMMLLMMVLLAMRLTAFL